MITKSTVYIIYLMILNVLSVSSSRDSSCYGFRTDLSESCIMFMVQPVRFWKEKFTLPETATG